MFSSVSDKLRVVAEIMANPEGAKAREPYQNFDGEGFPSESTISLVPRDWERGLENRSRPHLMKRGLGGDGGFERLCLVNGWTAGEPCILE
jgi:hypothetical protein